jgi:DNA-binding transcriptional ArsR family regulator
MDQGRGRRLGLTEAAAGDLVAWGLLWLGVVLGLAVLGAVALVAGVHGG